MKPVSRSRWRSFVRSPLACLEGLFQLAGSRHGTLAWGAAPMARHKRFRPALEALEDRALPSTLTVVNLDDAGAGSLRYELSQAQSGDTIVFDNRLSGGTITLTSGELQVDKSLDIEGLGQDALTVDGGGTGRVFEITTPGANVTIAGMTITDGVAPQGGGVLNDSGHRDERRFVRYGGLQREIR